MTTLHMWELTIEVEDLVLSAFVQVMVEQWFCLIIMVSIRNFTLIYC